MSLLHTLVYALVRGATTALPLSESGHAAALEIWFGTARELPALTLTAQIGSLAALAIAMRRRLRSAFSEALRGLKRPAQMRKRDSGRDTIGLACAVVAAALTEVVLQPFAQLAYPLRPAVAYGLLTTAIALVAETAAFTPIRLALSPKWAVVTGFGYGLAVMPGGSPLALSFVVMRSLGVARVQAAELALTITVFMLGFRVMRSLLTGPLGPTPAAGEMALSLVAAFVATSLAAQGWKTLSETGRTAWVAPWLLVLALALAASTHVP